MLMGANNFMKPRPPPVPPRPNKQIIDEAIARSKTSKTQTPVVSKTVIKSSDCCGEGIVAKFNKNNLNSVVGYPKSGSSKAMMINKKSDQQSRINLGQHVHDTESILYTTSNGVHHATKRPTVLLIANGKTSVKYGEPETQVRIAGGHSIGSGSKIRQSNWYQLDESSGQQIQYSSCQITVNSDQSCSISNSNGVVNNCVGGGVFSSHHRHHRSNSSSINNFVAMSSLQGLPPLPKSLSGANLLETSPSSTTAPSAPAAPPPPSPDVKLNRSSSVSNSHQLRISTGGSNSNSVTAQGGTTTDLKKSPAPPIPPRKMTTLDTQLAILRKEMVSATSLIYFYYLLTVCLSAQWLVLS